MTKIVTRYSRADHDLALSTARAVLFDDTLSYNQKRAKVQAVVKPLFAAEFSQAECEDVWDRAKAEHPTAGALTFKPNPSNFTQRMNIKTLLWIIMKHGAGSEWPAVWRNHAIHGIGGESFANVNIDDDAHEARIQKLKSTITGEKTMATTTTAAVLPSLPALGTVVDIIDVLIAECGMTASEASTALARLYPGDGGLIAGAENLRSLRGERTEPRPAIEGVIAEIVSAASKPGATTAMAVLPAVDLATAAVIDGVLSKLGLPSINSVIAKANEGAGSSAILEAAQKDVKRLADEVDEWKRKASTVVHAPVVVAASGEIPAGTVVMKNAADLWGVPAGKRKEMDFDVPCGEWKDAHGNDVPHPYVPALLPDFIFNLNTLVPILLSIVSGDKPWLRGHTGTGKTTVVEQVYARLNLPLYRVNLDSDISRSELVGALQLRHDPATGATVTKFEEGIIPRSMQEPCGLLLDEVDASRPDLAFVLQRLTEGKGFMLLEDGGRTIQANPWFRIFATANTNGRGDETGLYTGTRVLGSAFLNRFGPFLVVPYIDPKNEVKLVQMRAPTLDKALTEQIVGYAKEHRIAFMQGTVSLPCSPRDTVSLATRMVAYLSVFSKEQAVQLAFEHVVFNAADNDDLVVLKGLADRFIKASTAAAKSTT